MLLLKLYDQQEISFYASGVRLAALATTTCPTSNVRIVQAVIRAKDKVSTIAPKPRRLRFIKTLPSLTIPRKPHSCRFPKILADFYENFRILQSSQLLHISSRRSIMQCILQ